MPNNADSEQLEWQSISAMKKKKNLVLYSERDQKICISLFITFGNNSVKEVQAYLGISSTVFHWVADNTVEDTDA